MFNDTLIVENGCCPPGCSECEAACGLKMDSGPPRVQSFYYEPADFHGVVKCKQCMSPACARVCPTKAITRVNGIVRIDKERCVGCGLCTLECDSAGIFHDSETKAAYTCEMCDQEHACIAACTHGALSLGKTATIRKKLNEDILSAGVPLCQGCTEELAIRLAMRVFGKETFVFTGPGCAAPAISAVYSGGFLKTPAFVCRMTNMPAIMTGVKRHYLSIGKDVRCVGFAGDGMTADVGFQSLSGSAERGENLIYVCLDNEAYMNTGVQRSGTTPRLGWTTTTPIGEKARGKQKESKNVPLIMAFHGVPYVATATVAFPEDFVDKLLKAMAIKDGMSYIHVLVPCPTGWRAPTDQGIEISRLAVETGYFPLWEANRGEFRFTYQPKKIRPIKEFTQLMGRFGHLTRNELTEMEKMVAERLHKITRLVNPNVA